jgi:hypothetical protein
VDGATLLIALPMTKGLGHEWADSENCWTNSPRLFILLSMISLSFHTLVKSKWEETPIRLEPPVPLGKQRPLRKLETKRPLVERRKHTGERNTKKD